MAKKNAGKVIQMLSPENYIRKKARSLPIHECLVNEEWQEQGFANLVIARSHTNGNITACIYLVDLYCLGVKDTHYLFNSTRLNYHEKFGGNDKMNFKPISYTLAHNIVYAGLEFAEEYGFIPHKDFTSITRFMLEEDTEDVELIDIECGKDGKPFYVSGPYDDDQKIRKIVAQLEKTAGAGNYDYILPGSDDEYDEEDEEDDEYLDKLEGLSFEEKSDMFLKLESYTEPLNEEETERFIYITNSLFKEFTDTTLVDEYYDEYMDDMDVELTAIEIPDEMLGITKGSVQISELARELFMTIYSEGSKNLKRSRKLLEKFRKETGDIPASYFLEMEMNRDLDSPKFMQNLHSLQEKFPDYSLLRIAYLNARLEKEKVPDEFFEQNYSLQTLFPGRTLLHHVEIFQYLTFITITLFRCDNPSKIEAFQMAYEDIDLIEEEIELLDRFITLAKIHSVHQYLTH